MEKLFWTIYNTKYENQLHEIVKTNSFLNNNDNWFPYGDENYFGVIEGQQASPIPALVEKITNSIDAILMRKCYESNINPKSNDAPKSMEKAVEIFFPDYKNWDLIPFRKNQAESIQIIADGPRMDTSLIIYDDGEGQHPYDFENTLLSLLKGNKNEIHFVQGKYNMGGSGALSFCGKKRYQLIASKKYNGNGEFGFTLMRRHLLHESERKKETWYEYFKVEGKIPSFPIEVLDLGLYNKKFKTGTIIKLYSYRLPPGSRSVISRDLNQSINEYLFEPALPIFTIDNRDRYPDDKNLERDLYGLKRRLEEEKSKYVEEYYVEEYDSKDIGKVKVTCYIFNTKIEGKTVKESKISLRREFFKNNMSVLFSQNGQVHGNYTTEFITRSLKYPILKDYLLIHVDCTNIKYDFRRELFMSQRDRLKEGEESAKLREIVSNILRKGRLNEIYKRRRDSISIENGDTQELLKSFTKNLPLKNDLIKLLNNTFKLDQVSSKKEEKKKTKKKIKTQIHFNPQRFPSFFKLNTNVEEGKPISKIPIGGERTINFSSDVENEYFVRVEEPGELNLAVIGYKPNDQDGGDKKGIPRDINEVFNVIKKSPNNSTIKVVLNPNDTVSIGDSIQIKATLTNPGSDFDQIFWVKISEPENKKEKAKKEENDNNENIGLPDYILVYKGENPEEKEDQRLTWAKVEDNSGIEMDFQNVMYPYVEGDHLSKIYINMDSNVLKNYKSNLNTEEQFELADKKYISSIYFHTIFLFTISKSRNYTMTRTMDGNEEEKDIVDYLTDIFNNYYSQFLLNFEMATLIQSLDS